VFRVETPDGRRLTVLLPKGQSTRTLGIRPGARVTVEGVTTSVPPDRQAMGLTAGEARALVRPSAYVFATRARPEAVSPPPAPRSRAGAG
jgi:hypothetical protein